MVLSGTKYGVGDGYDRLMAVGEALATWRMSPALKEVHSRA